MVIRRDRNTKYLNSIWCETNAPVYKMKIGYLGKIWTYEISACKFLSIRERWWWFFSSVRIPHFPILAKKWQRNPPKRLNIITLSSVRCKWIRLSMFLVLLDLLGPQPRPEDQVCTIYLLKSLNWLNLDFWGSFTQLF